MLTQTQPGTHYFTATGKVLGTLFNGVEAGYPAKKITATSLAELKDKIVQGIKDGTLDKGAGFSSLSGAMLFISEITEHEKENGQVVTTETRSLETFGELTPADQDFLFSIL